MFTLTGTPIAGCGIAHETIAFQKPFLKKWFPQIEQCHVGTINLSLSAALVIAQPDIITEPFLWSTGWTQDVPPEHFHFTQFEFDIAGKASNVTGWVYEASWSIHRSNAMMLEFVAPYTAYEKGDLFTLRFAQKHREASAYVVEN